MYFADVDKIYQKVMARFDENSSANIISHDLIKAAFRKRAANLHKGTAGSLMVIAGSEGLTGAAYMASETAMRCGTGMTVLACQRELNPIFELKLTEVMTLPVDSNGKSIAYSAYKQLMPKLMSSDAVLYGPGLSEHEDIKKLLAKLTTSLGTPMVTDADGLNAISKDINILKNAKAPMILTPHIGEFARLTGKSTEYVLRCRDSLAMEFARRYCVILVLKSHDTIVTDGNVIYYNILGNPGMAKGGSGDVLAGAVASLLSQGNTPLLSALAGVYIHSLAADMAKEITGEYSLAPTDIMKALPYAINMTQIYY